MRQIKEAIVDACQHKPEYFERYLNNNSLIKLDSSRIDLSLLCGEERKTLKTPTTGDSSLVLRYKEKEGSVLSITTELEELSILQLQGAKSSISYKVASGIDWVRIFGDQVELITRCCPDYFRIISMPSLDKIEGLYDCQSETVVDRYLRFANILGLAYSKVEQKYFRELNPKK